ncbi:MAG: Photosystem I reaction center subunit III [Cyanosarcina radialis HA8281-LM2]|nr:Photosystem I reaction center subunit III [Cyanosarcina radialis HA8281-LM2]
MRRLLAVIFAFTIWFTVVPSASADIAGLTPCSESQAFQQRAANARATTSDPNSGRARFERYSGALCGPEGLPRLIVDGRYSHAGDFLIPSVLFLYITGCIGWAGRSYLMTTRAGKDPEMKEVIIDVPLAIKSMISAGAWPALALAEFTSGKLLAKDADVPVSPR